MISNLTMRLLFLVAFGLTVQVYSQSNNTPGYIVTLNNDTIEGFIKDKGDKSNNKHCIFSTRQKGKFRKYSPGEIQAFELNKEKRYVSKEIMKNGKFISLFFTVLMEGQINLYQDFLSEETAFYIETKKDGMLGLTMEKVFLRPEELNTKVTLIDTYYATYKHYQKTLDAVFQDSEELVNYIPFINYNAQDFMSLTKAYIEETCEGDTCISFVRKF